MSVILSILCLTINLVANFDIQVTHENTPLVHYNKIRDCYVTAVTKTIQGYTTREQSTSAVQNSYKLQYNGK